MSETHPPANPLPRRAMLAASGTAVLAVAAACSSGTSASGAAATSASTTTSTTSAGASPSASSPATAASSSAAASSAPATSAATSAEAAPTGTPLASVADVQAAGSVVVGDGANPYLLAYAGDTVVAHTAICTHQQCAIAASGNCPCHGSEFDVATGAVLKGPAQRPLAELPVTISGGQVYRA